MTRTLFGFFKNSAVLFGVIALVGGLSMAVALAGTIATTLGQGAAITVHVIPAAVDGYRAADAQMSQIPATPAPAPKKRKAA